MQTADLVPRGKFEARYLAFLETISHLRPRLHRYCARMTGSLTDGEDVVQEALFQAYRKLDTFDESLPLTPWLFRITHNRCIDFLRARGVREQAESAGAGPLSVAETTPVGFALGRAVEHLVVTLPPKERACVLLKDVLDYSLEEIAELVESTVGGVKAALNRGRMKLAALREQESTRRPISPEASQLLQLYVERFNGRDWDGLRELIAADATLRVCDRFTGRLADAPYFATYMRSLPDLRLAVAEVDGQAMVVTMSPHGDSWTPESIVHIDVSDGRVVNIVDYVHCPWVLESAETLVVERPS
jgi:RNA polymerase sigma-70 factor (ECF subfamily)